MLAKRSLPSLCREELHDYHLNEGGPMDQNMALMMFDVKQKLAHLEKHLKEPASPLTYDFGHFLALYLHTKLRPQEFVEEMRMAIADLKVGVNGFTNAPITGPISGHPRLMYDALAYEFPKIVKAVLPEDFAAHARNFFSSNETIEAG